MKIKDSAERELEIRNKDWPLAEDLFIRWGYSSTDNEIRVSNINDITSELSAWGIPWKRIEG